MFNNTTFNTNDFIEASAANDVTMSIAARFLACASTVEVLEKIAMYRKWYDEEKEGLRSASFKADAFYRRNQEDILDKPVHTVLKEAHNQAVRAARLLCTLNAAAKRVGERPILNQFVDLNDQGECMTLVKQFLACWEANCEHTTIRQFRSMLLESLKIAG